MRQHIELPLTQKERLGLTQSARVLRETIQQVLTRLNQSTTPASVAQAPAHTSVRAIPRSAWQRS
jgi:hypothetical protein